jgi:hypothetical protein
VIREHCSAVPFGTIHIGSGNFNQSGTILKINSTRALSIKALVGARIKSPAKKNKKLKFPCVNPRNSTAPPRITGRARNPCAIIFREEQIKSPIHESIVTRLL